MFDLEIVTFYVKRVITCQVIILCLDVVARLAYHVQTLILDVVSPHMQGSIFQIGLVANGFRAKDTTF